ncbi:MAG: DUF928 domain-containing protein [Gammaproteobacteria bacterium]|nr:DUF928 domain-containing protein [Gammaproteobacteria bacterium]
MNNSQFFLLIAALPALLQAPLSEAQCPPRYQTENLPCYHAPMDGPKRRRVAGFYEEASVSVQRGGDHQSALGRGFSHAFIKTLRCGTSKGFPEQLRCGVKTDRLLHRMSPARITGKRGEHELMTWRQIDGEDIFSIANMAPDIAPLAPEHIGLSRNALPVLYWFFSTPWPGDIVFTLSPEGGKPLLEKRLPPPPSGFDDGIHSLALADYGIYLETGVEYEWSVTIPGDPEQPASDLTASAVIRYAPEVTAEQRTHDLAQAGLWHDAIQRVSMDISTQPENPVFRRYRSALLEQVSLPQAVIEHDLLN